MHAFGRQTDRHRSQDRAYALQLHGKNLIYGIAEAVLILNRHTNNRLEL